GAFTIPYAVPAAGATEDELVLTLRLVTKENAPWAPAGHEIAFGQFILPAAPARIGAAKREAATGTITIGRESDALVVSGSGFRLVWDGRTGDRASYQWDGVELLASPVVPNFWRAVTDNDRGNGHPGRCAVWRTAGRQRELVRLDYGERGGF